MPATAATMGAEVEMQYAWTKYGQAEQNNSGAHQTIGWVSLREKCVSVSLFKF